jgi:hypothetical protein
MANKTKTETGITAVAAPQFDIKRAPLPAAELAKFRYWILTENHSDTEAATKAGVLLGVLYSAKAGKVISARNLFALLGFIKKLPEVKS